MDPIAEAREVALRYLDYAPRTCSEVRSRLARDAYDDEVIEAVLADLKRSGFIDDSQLAHDWIESRTRVKGLGRVRLAMELKRKGIDPDLVDEAVDEISSDDELENALRLMEKRFSAPDVGDPVIRRKIVGYLQRRGYSWELIEQVFDKLTVK